MVKRLVRIDYLPHGAYPMSLIRAEDGSCLVHYEGERRTWPAPNIRFDHEAARTETNTLVTVTARHYA